MNDLKNMMDEAKYKGALLAFKEWQKSDSVVEFKGWVEDKIKPVDPLKEKWYRNRPHRSYMSEEGWDDMFETVMIIFKEELNGTKGLDELRELVFVGNYTGEWLRKNIDIIKGRLENEAKN